MVEVFGNVDPKANGELSGAHVFSPTGQLSNVSIF